VRLKPMLRQNKNSKSSVQARKFLLCRSSSARSRSVTNFGCISRKMFLIRPTRPSKLVLAGAEPNLVHKALVVLDESLAQAQAGLGLKIERYFDAHSGRLTLARPPMVIEGGERTKNSYFHVSEIHSQVDRYHIDRHSYVIGVGGGALLDVVGLAAATAHRGLRHVRIPTTTLSQNDSGVGVKNGINAFGKKNFIGTFAPPFAVINDFQLLSSLSPRDKRAGYVEAVKVALIRDKDFFESIEREAGWLREFEPAAMQRLIYRCAELHVNHIASSGDPFEFGSARPLDFGHWSAHKLEQLSEYKLRHGEAVAIGIALDTIYSRKLGNIEPASADRVLKLLETLGFELYANELLHVDAGNSLLVLEGLEEFRQHLGGELTITLLAGIGHGFEVHEMNLAKSDRSPLRVAGPACSAQPEGDSRDRLSGLSQADATHGRHQRRWPHRSAHWPADAAHRRLSPARRLREDCSGPPGAYLHCPIHLPDRRFTCFSTGLSATAGTTATGRGASSGNNPIISSKAKSCGRIAGARPEVHVPQSYSGGITCIRPPTTQSLRVPRTPPMAARFSTFTPGHTRFGARSKRNWAIFRFPLFGGRPPASGRRNAPRMPPRAG